jgi:plasmid stability protein
LALPVVRLNLSRKLHQQLREEAALHHLSFDAEVLARVADSFSYQHWIEQRDPLLSLSGTR